MPDDWDRELREGLALRRLVAELDMDALRRVAFVLIRPHAIEAGHGAAIVRALAEEHGAHPVAVRVLPRLEPQLVDALYRRQDKLPRGRLWLQQEAFGAGPAAALLLAGDAGGMVNPFNGEGIAYAMESGEIAAQVVTQALSRPAWPETERVLHTYPQALKDAYGGYYTLGRLFVRAIGRPELMKFATRHGLRRPTAMRFVLKLLANLTDPRDGDAADRVINAMSRLAPAA